MNNNSVVIVSYTSWYHLLGVFSYLKYMGVRPTRSIVVVNSFLDKARIYDRGILSEYLGDYHFCLDYEDVGRQVASLRDAEIYVVSTSPTPYRLTVELRKRNMEYKIVVVEEGIGSYGSIVTHLAAQSRESRKNGIMRYFYLFKLVALMLFKYLVFFKTEKHFWYNFDKSGRIVNVEVAGAYVKVLEEIRTKQKEQTIIEGGERVALFLGAPFCELGIVDDAGYLLKLDAVLSRYDKVYVKPHPAENLDKYSNAKFQVVGKDDPFELIYSAEWAGMDIYGFTSTCFYTSFLFFDKRIIRFSDYDPFYLKLSGSQRLIIDKVSLCEGAVS